MNDYLGTENFGKELQVPSRVRTLVAFAERVGADKRGDLLVVEAHLVEDVAHVLGALIAIGQTAIGRARLGALGVRSA